MERFTQILTGVFIALFILYGLLLIAIFSNQIQVVQSLANIEDRLSEWELIE
jgi:hypothetical protein